MKMIQARVTIIAMAVLMSFGAAMMFAGPAMADVQQATLEWQIAVDVTIALSFPTTLSNILWTNDTGEFTDLNSSLSTSATASIRLTNNGNVAINASVNHTTDFPSGVTLHQTCDAATGTPPVYSGSCYNWADTNETTGIQLVSNLAISGTDDWWSWSTGSGLAAGTYTMSNNYRWESSQYIA